MTRVLDGRSGPRARRGRARVGGPPSVGGSAGRVLGDELEPARRVAPDPLEVGAHCLDALVVEPVDASGPARFLDDESGLPQEPEVARDGRARDRQRVGELLDRAVAGPEQFHDGSPVGVAERLERVADGLRCGPTRPLGDGAAAGPGARCAIRSRASGCSSRRGSPRPGRAPRATAACTRRTGRGAPS